MITPEPRLLLCPIWVSRTHASRNKVRLKVVLATLLRELILTTAGAAFLMASLYETTATAFAGLETVAALKGASTGMWVVSHGASNKVAAKPKPASTGHTK